MSVLSLVSLYCVVLCFVISSAGPVAPPSGQYSTDSSEIEFPKPYEFGFKMDDGNGTVQHRQETANENGSVRGKYGYVDANGMYREVEYNADENGYHVKILSNEPGITNQNSADVVYVVKANQSA